MSRGVSPRGKRLNEHLSSKLRVVFESVAYTALEAADEASSDSIHFLPKLRMAHSRITEIVDQAMSGLAEAHESVFVMDLIDKASNDEETPDRDSPKF